MSVSRYILTGAPGTGKTAILSELGGEIRWVGEPAREVLAEHRARTAGRRAAIDHASFVDLLLQRSIEKYQESEDWGGAVVFDRGVPDCIAYALQLGTDPEPSIRAAQRYRYHPDVLITEPWAEIYTTDDERTMTFRDTVQFHGHIEAAYRAAGYRLVEVPRRPLPQRTAFVSEFIGGAVPP